MLTTSRRESHNIVRSTCTNVPHSKRAEFIFKLPGKQVGGGGGKRGGRGERRRGEREEG